MVAEGSEDVAEVNLQMREFDTKEALEVGDIKSLAVKRDQDIETTYIGEELLEIVAIYVKVDEGAVIQGNSCDVVVCTR